MSQEERRKKPVRFILTRPILYLLLGLLGAFLLLFPPPLPILRDQMDRLELITRDLRMSLRPAQKLNNKIIIVGLTDLDHILYGSEIDSREAYQLLLQALQHLGVRAVIFDILFEHHKPMDSTFSMKIQELPTYLSYKFLEERPPIPDLEKELFPTGFPQMPPAMIDSLTTSAIREEVLSVLDRLDELSTRRTEAFHNLDDKTVAEIDLSQSRLRFLVGNLSRMYLEKCYGIKYPHEEEGRPPEAQFVILPTEQILLNSSGSGFINVVKTKEEVVRHVPLFIKYKDKLYPHLDLVFLCDYYGVALNELKITFGKWIEFHPRKNDSGTKRIPIDETGRLVLNFREGDPFLRRNSYPLHQVLHYARFGSRYPTRIKPETFRDAIVIVGELNPGGADIEPIPIMPAFPLVGIHATVINMVQNDDYIYETSPATTAAITLIFGLFVGMIFSLVEYKPASLSAFLLLVLYLILSVFSFNKYSLYIPVVRPAGTILLSYLFLIFYVVGIKERERRWVRNVFLKSVSPRIGEEILRHYDDEAIWGVKKDVTVLFVDIRGFTALSECLSARELVDFLDAYYDTVSQIIFQYDGVVNKFIGDAVMALFGAPLELPDAEVRAVKAALDIQVAISELNNNPILSEKGKKIGVGIGVSTGEVVVGTVGHKRIRIEYTALGDNVNVAERLEGIALQGEIYINSELYQRVKNASDEIFKKRNITFEPLPPLLLRGKDKPVDAYRVRYS